MTDTVSFQNIDPSSWITLYNNRAMNDDVLYISRVSDVKVWIWKEAVIYIFPTDTPIFVLRVWPNWRVDGLYPVRI